MAPAVVSNLPLAACPSSVTAAMQTTAISATMSTYSTRDAPSSSRTSVVIRCFNVYSISKYPPSTDGSPVGPGGRLLQRPSPEGGRLGPNCAIQTARPSNPFSCVYRSLPARERGTAWLSSCSTLLLELPSLRSSIFSRIDEAVCFL